MSSRFPEAVYPFLILNSNFFPSDYHSCIHIIPIRLSCLLSSHHIHCPHIVPLELHELRSSSVIMGMYLSVPIVLLYHPNQAQSILIQCLSICTWSTVPWYQHSPSPCHYQSSFIRFKFLKSFIRVPSFTQVQFLVQS